MTRSKAKNSKRVGLCTGNSLHVSAAARCKRYDRVRVREVKLESSCGEPQVLN